MGVYISRDNIEAVFGVDRVEAWASLTDDDTSTDITNRITEAINYAEGYFDAMFRGSQYLIPLEASGSSLILVQSLIATIAGSWLYNLRGMDDELLQNKLDRMEEKAEHTLQKILSGQLQLDATLQYSHWDAPEAI